MNTDLTKRLERLETRINRLTATVQEFVAKSYYSPDQERDEDGQWSGGGGGKGISTVSGGGAGTGSDIWTPSRGWPKGRPPRDIRKIDIGIDRIEDWGHPRRENDKVLKAHWDKLISLDKQINQAIRKTKNEKTKSLLDKGLSIVDKHMGRVSREMDKRARHAAKLAGKPIKDPFGRKDLE